MLGQVTVAFRSGKLALDSHPEEDSESLRFNRSCLEARRGQVGVSIEVVS